jgi:transposase InsO family protein
MIFIQEYNRDCYLAGILLISTMLIVKIFLMLFRICAFSITLRYPAFSKLALIWIELNYCRRYFNEKNIRYPFKPHEKHIVNTFFTLTKNPSRFFTLVSTKTVLNAWKNAAANHWANFSKKRKPGRPQVSKNTKQLILKLKKDNWLWGARRIRDELNKLSITVSHETIMKVLRQFRKKGDIQPNLSWKRFLSSHWKSLFACDFFTVDSFGFKRFYVFFILELKTRKIVQYGITANPEMHFLRRQFSLFEFDYPGSMLIHDNSNELRWFPYEQYNIRNVKIVPYSPNMNAYAERFVRSVRSECLDYFVIFTYKQLHNLIKSYVDYYNNYRPHQGLKGIPNAQEEQHSTGGVIKQMPLLFGLHNHYYRDAA